MYCMLLRFLKLIRDIQAILTYISPQVRHPNGNPIYGALDM